MIASPRQFLEAPPRIDSGFAKYANAAVLIPETNAPPSSHFQRHLERPREFDIDLDERSTVWEMFGEHAPIQLDQLQVHDRPPSPQHWRWRGQHIGFLDLRTFYLSHCATTQ